MPLTLLISFRHRRYIYSNDDETVYDLYPNGNKCEANQKSSGTRYTTIGTYAQCVDFGEPISTPAADEDPDDTLASPDSPFAGNLP